jgi:hypothetical protein
MLFIRSSNPIAVRNVILLAYCLLSHVSGVEFTTSDFQHSLRFRSGDTTAYDYSAFTYLDQFKLGRRLSPQPEPVCSHEVPLQSQHATMSSTRRAAGSKTGTELSAEDIHTHSHTVSVALSPWVAPCITFSQRIPVTQALHQYHIPSRHLCSSIRSA